MTKSNLDEDLEKEEEVFEYEEYIESGTKDKFDLWKAKEYIDEQLDVRDQETKQYTDEKIRNLIIGLIIGAAIVLWFLR